MGIGKATPSAEQEILPSKPAPSTFQPYKGQRRKPGTGCVSQINDHLWEGRYSPIVDGKRMARNIYTCLLYTSPMAGADGLRPPAQHAGTLP